MQKNNTIIGIGNALMDLTFEVQSLSEIKPSLEKDSACLLSNDDWNLLRGSLAEPIHFSPGGSACNTISGIASLGGSSGFVGVVGCDSIAENLRQDLKNNHISSYLVQSPNPEDPTGCCIVIITPDGNRTMATCLGASVNLKSDHIPENVISSAHSIFLEGFLFDKPDAKQSFIKAAKIARDNNVQVVFSVSDIACVRAHKSEILQLLPQIDLIFGNFKEIQLLTDTNTPEDACNALRRFGVNMACITLDEKGAITLYEGKIVHTRAHAVSEIIDLNGAGDGFAAGFLFALSKNTKFHEAAKVGNIFAAHIIQEHGSRINSNSIGKIKNLLYEIQPRLVL